MHVLANPWLRTALARISGAQASMGEVLITLRGIYSCILHAAASELPRVPSQTPTRMAEKHPETGILREEVLDPECRAVVVDVIRAFSTAAVESAGLGTPAYVVTGLFEDEPERTAADDRLTVDVIERARHGEPIDPDSVAAALLATDEAERTLRLGPQHCDPSDIELAAQVDAFDFAMEVGRTEIGLRLERRS